MEYKLKKALKLIDLELSDSDFKNMLSLIQGQIDTLDNMFKPFINNYEIKDSSQTFYTVLDINRNINYCMNYHDMPVQAHLNSNPLKLQHNCNLIKIIKNK